jgi:hypothetical protein
MKRMIFRGADAAIAPEVQPPQSRHKTARAVSAASLCHVPDHGFMLPPRFAGNTHATLYRDCYKPSNSPRRPADHVQATDGSTQEGILDAWCLKYGLDPPVGTATFTNLNGYTRLQSYVADFVPTGSG